jgi:uncharacterized protein YcfJ
MQASRVWKESCRKGRKKGGTNATVQHHRPVNDENTRLNTDFLGVLIGALRQSTPGDAFVEVPDHHQEGEGRR